MTAPLDLDAIERDFTPDHLPEEACTQDWCEHDERVIALIAEVRRLREAERWIPVGERLPEHDTLVLVFRPDHGLAQELYFGDGKFVHVNMREAKDVTHWRVMPAGPVGSAP